MARGTWIMFCSLLAGMLIAQTVSTTERLTRIEENTNNLKEAAKAADSKNEELRRNVEAVRERVVTVDSQNVIIIKIASTAFTIGLAFLIWLAKRMEELQKLKAEGRFTPEDRELLLKIHEKLSEAKSDGGRAKTTGA